MLNLRDESKWTYIKTFLKKLHDLCSAALVIIITILVVLFIVTFAIRSVSNVQIIYIDRWKPWTYTTSHKFLSIGLDSSVIADDFKNFNVTDTKLIKMIKYLNPAYLRVGGNLADRLYFSANSTEPYEDITKFYRASGYCDSYSDLHLAPNYTMTGTQWLQLMKMVQQVNLDIFFDLNALIRFENGSWDYRNAESLIKFSNEHRFKVNWELGNEPSSYKHKFNKEVNATQMARDFFSLRRILRKYRMYRKALLVGPDTTRPLEEHKESEIYLRNFLKNAIHVVDAITWHQYYIDGRTAKPEDFLNPDVFDLLKTQIQAVKNLTKQFHAWNKPIWLGETSSAYGGGAPNLSDTFIGSFIWIDKLGLSAKMGIDVVVRQSIFKGYYALLDENYDPNPDWWISILYKKLVGLRVVPYYTACSPKVRLYCHCTQRNIFAGNPPALTVFGVNMDNSTANIRIEGLFPLEDDDNGADSEDGMSVYAFELTADHSLFSKNVRLNGKVLKMLADNSLPELLPKIIALKPFVTMPPLSVVFWVVPSPYVNACFYNNML